jgi:hypothetical protein
MISLVLVKQPEPKGCGIACLSMILGRSYDDLCKEYGRRFQDRGTNLPAVKEFLGNHGWSSISLFRYLFINFDCEKVNIPRAEWPPAPFAPVHIAEVKQPSGNTHFVLMRADGTVLDPLRDGEFQLKDWPEIYGVHGFWKIQDS